MGLFESFDKNNYKKDIYAHLWNESNLPGTIINTYANNLFSKNSYEFDFSGFGVDNKKIRKSDEYNICRGLKSLFKPKAIDFDEKCHFACFGSGNEYKEILRLHSSALCALLMFCDVSENNPIHLDLCSNGKVASVSFTKVLYEYQNKVINMPSNVDIVLVGKIDASGKDVILFLESKFSEYLNNKAITNQYKRLGKEYLEKPYDDLYYNEHFLNPLGVKIIRSSDNVPKIFEYKKNGKKEECYGFETINQEKTYLEGLKQLISHYIGLTNFLSPNIFDKRKDNISPEGREIYLGEILFDFKFEDAQKKLELYSSYYKKLSKSLNEKNANIHVLDDTIRYSALNNQEYSISDVIKRFYFI